MRDKATSECGESANKRQVLMCNALLVVVESSANARKISVQAGQRVWYRCNLWHIYTFLKLKINPVALEATTLI